MPKPGLPFILLSSPKDAFRAVKKRIIGNKNFHEVMLALTVSFPSICLSIPLSVSSVAGPQSAESHLSSGPVGFSSTLGLFI